MKKILIALAAVLLFAGCTQKYDDSDVIARLSNLEIRVSTLETSVDALRSAVGDGIFVTKVEEFKDPTTGKTTGITVTYTTGDVKHFTITPANDTPDPVISIIQDGTGALCWAVDGVLIQVGGHNVPVYQTPVFSIDKEGNLCVTVDGETVVLGMVQSGGATLEDGIFTDLKVTDKAVILTLADGSKVNVPFAEAFKLNIEKTEYTYSKPDPIEIPYTVSAKTASTIVDVWHPNDFSAKVEADKIIITPLTPKTSGQILAYADSKVGLTSIVKITIEAEGVRIIDTPASDKADYIIDGDGGTVVANVVSNIDFDVLPIEKWIQVVSVKSAAYAITLKIEPNAGAYREGRVEIVRKGTSETVQTIIIGQMPAVAGPKDIGKNGTANCYIISEAGEYKFAAVKGNSSESIGAAASAAILWETWNNEEEVAANSVIASVSYADGFIGFTTPETLKPGNALIAAKDAAGTILWSWHIWIPETEIAVSTFGDISYAPMMDRNIGALIATAEAPKDTRSYGMYYSWGRKDPFMPSKITTAPAGAITFDGAVVATAAESVATPTVYITTGGDSVKDWNQEAVNTLWGKTKTIYDPCPPGYIIPTRDKSCSFWGGLSGAAGWEANTGDGWFKAGVAYDAANPATTGFAVFPYCGYIDQGSLTHENDRVYIWSSYASSSEGNIAYQIYINGSSTSTTEQRKSRAGNIRCVVEPVAE